MKNKRISRKRADDLQKKFSRKISRRRMDDIFLRKEKIPKPNAEIRKKILIATFERILC